MSNRETYFENTFDIIQKYFYLLIKQTTVNDTASIHYEYRVTIIFCSQSI